MDIDEVKQFEEKWNIIYSEGVEEILKKADNNDFSVLDKKLYVKIHALVTDILLMKSIKIPLKINDKLELIIKTYSTEVSIVLYYIKLYIYIYIYIYINY